MTATLTFYPRGNADDGKKMLIDYADMRNRLSEAGYAYERSCERWSTSSRSRLPICGRSISRRFLRFTPPRSQNQR